MKRPNGAASTEMWVNRTIVEEWDIWSNLLSHQDLAPDMWQKMNGWEKM